MPNTPTSLHIPLSHQPSSNSTSDWSLNPDDYNRIAERYETPHPPPCIRLPFTRPCAPIRRSYIIGNPSLYGETFEPYLFQGFTGRVFYDGGVMSQEAAFRPSDQSALTEEVLVQIQLTPFRSPPHVQ